MQLIAPEQMRKIDKYCNDKTDLKESVLIAHAGEALARELVKSYTRIRNKKFVFICGKGNNGADGKKAAAVIKKHGAEVKVVDITEKKYEMPNLEEYDAVVDCILGTGFHGELSEEIAGITKAINESGKIVFAADIPTGVNALTGAADENAVRATVTVAFCSAKPGHALYPGRELCGKLKVWDIGIPQEIISQFAEPAGFYYSDIHKKELLNIAFPKRPAECHKGNFGRVGILAGSRGMCGAAALCAEAALRTGAGLVYSFVPEDCIGVMETILRENIKVDASKLSEYIEKLDVLAIGPGLGRDEDIKNTIIETIKAAGNNEHIKLVIDADGITAFAGSKELLKELLAEGNLGERTIITPHMGEFTSLTEMSEEEIKEDKVKAVREAAEYFGCAVLLKGADTVTAKADCYTINGSGNPGMATAGSGDVLTGMIAAMAPRMSVYDAGRYGAFYHGVKGDKAAALYGEYGMISGDMLK